MRNDVDDDPGARAGSEKLFQEIYKRPPPRSATPQDIKESEDRFTGRRKPTGQTDPNIERLQALIYVWRHRMRLPKLKLRYSKDRFTVAMRSVRRFVLKVQREETATLRFLVGQTTADVANLAFQAVFGTLPEQPVTEESLKRTACVVENGRIIVPRDTPVAEVIGIAATSKTPLKANWNLAQMLLRHGRRLIVRFWSSHSI